MFLGRLRRWGTRACGCVGRGQGDAVPLHHTRVYPKNSLRLHLGVFSAISTSESLDLATAKPSASLLELTKNPLELSPLPFSDTPLARELSSLDLPLFFMRPCQLVRAADVYEGKGTPSPCQGTEFPEPSAFYPLLAVLGQPALMRFDQVVAHCDDFVDRQFCYRCDFVVLT